MRIVGVFAFLRDRVQVYLRLRSFRSPIFVVPVVYFFSIFFVVDARERASESSHELGRGAARGFLP